MRVSKLFGLLGPEPEPVKLLMTPGEVGFGNAARMLAACGEIRPMGIRFPAKGVRPEPSALLPVRGSNTWPPWLMEGFPRYSLRLQKPGVLLWAFVAGLQDCWTTAVGIVNWLVMPPVCRVPW